MPVADHPRYSFVQADIADATTIRELLASFQPDVIMHLAAEGHVDRSIDGPAAFIQTNVVGTFVLLQQALGYWRELPSSRAEKFRFHHISTDEVFGSLGTDGLFDEETAHKPNSPYSASKAASDHLVRVLGNPAVSRATSHSPMPAVYRRPFRQPHRQDGASYLSFDGRLSLRREEQRADLEASQQAGETMSGRAEQHHKGVASYGAVFPLGCIDTVKPTCLSLGCVFGGVNVRGQKIGVN